jgi:hypothetical protein
MTDLGYMIWFAASAVMTLTVLTIGTLAAADLLPHHRRKTDDAAATRPEAARPATLISHSDHPHKQQHGDAA